MEIIVSGRQTVIPEAFKSTVEDKLSKIESVSPKTQTVKVEVSHENNPKLSDSRLKVEITVIGEGPIVRSEAAAHEALSAFDIATETLFERLRRAHDRSSDRRVAKKEKAHENEVQNSKFDISVLEEELVNQAKLVHQKAKEQGKKFDEQEALEGDLPAGESVEVQLSGTPVVIKRKVHAGENLSIEEALERMELLGHDFYIFTHGASKRPAVIYRRGGWGYGVVELD